MKTITESILGSNSASLEGAIKDWWTDLDYYEHKNYDLIKDDKGKILYVKYKGTAIDVEREFDKKLFPSFVEFGNLDTISLYNPSDDVLKRLSSILCKTLFVNTWRNGHVAGLPRCEELHLDDCKLMVDMTYPYQLKSIEINNCPKFNAIPSLPDVTDSISFSECNSITSLEGLKPFQGSITINKCVNFTSLKGCPETLKGNLVITNNVNFTNLEGFPRIVKDSIILKKNGRDFTKDEIKGICKCAKIR